MVFQVQTSGGGGRLGGIQRYRVLELEVERRVKANRPRG